MTLSMPPTMTVTFGSGSSAPPFALGAVPRQPASAAIVSTARPATILLMRYSLDLYVGGSGRRAPAQQPVLGRGQRPFREEGDDGDNDHSGVDAGRVEGSLCGRDEQPEALIRTGVLADDRADQREPEGRVQRREDPRRGAGYDDRDEYLERFGAKDPGVVHQIPVDLAGTLEALKNTAKKTSTTAVATFDDMPS